MKQVLFVLIIAALASGLAGCDQAQQALDTIDKAKSFKDDIEKKAKDVKEKALGLIPGESGSGPGGKEEGNKEKDSKEEGGKGSEKEKDD